MRSYLSLMAAVVFVSSFLGVSHAAENAAEPIVVVVMDPLAKPLSCPCVAGYAQRDYEKLGAALEKSLKRQVNIIFNESLVAAIKKHGLKQVHLVIGKQSVIMHDAELAGLTLGKVAMLTGKDGLTTQRGLVVVPAGDKAAQISDLKGVRIYFGPEECDEKHTAALRLFEKHGIEKPTTMETAVACDEGAINILDLAKKGDRGCAVISSYAKPLLEGCGQVPKGALRVVGETEEVPFIAAFINEAVEEDLQASLGQALLKVTASDVALRIALETKRGFIEIEENDGDVAKKK
jgi:ABC-type phosphate/phosphonate transport system substrate-binding protein